ncbi:metal/formaldehyde-sensitive transcriptional repressor [Paracoccus haeundaensis]
MIRVAASELLYVTAFAYLGKQYDLLVRQKVKMTFFLDTHGLPSGSAIAVTTITTPLCKASLRMRAQQEFMLARLLPGGHHKQRSLHEPEIGDTPIPMSHTSHHQAKLLARVRRLKGQIEAVERSLETGAPCGDLLNLVASIRGAVGGLTAELIEDHIREHVSDPDKDADPDRAQASGELISVIRTYLK